MKEQELKKWFPYGMPDKSLLLRLFCFPYAGGGASQFRNWGASLSPHLQVIPVQLPGREQRFTEIAFDDLNLLVECLYEVLSPYLDVPYAFFGHSMGALIAFELAHFCMAKNTRLPEKLFLSSYRAPVVRHDPYRDLTDEKIFKRISRLNGIPQDVLDNEEFKNLFMPLFRADYRLCRSYRYQERAQLPCSMKVYAGTSDVVPLNDLMAWRHKTSGNFNSELFHGNHFYLKESQKELLSDIQQELKGL